MTKSQIPNVDVRSMLSWDVGFGISLGFGIWALGFDYLSQHPRAHSRNRLLLQ